MDLTRRGRVISCGEAGSLDLKRRGRVKLTSPLLQNQIKTQTALVHVFIFPTYGLPPITKPYIDP